MTSIGNVVRIGVLRTPWGRRPQHRLRAKGFAAEPEDDTNPADAFTHRLSGKTVTREILHICQ